MDVKYRNILDANRVFLVKNIILGCDFYSELRDGKILTETMIKDIQDGRTPEERNEKLVSFIQMKGGSCFRKFRNLLQMTGHNFLADHLYGEEYGHISVKTNDIFRKFDDVFSYVSDDCKSKFKNYLNGKVKETTLQLSWVNNSAARCDFLDTHTIYYKQEKLLRDSIAEKERRIQELQKQLHMTQEELEKTNLNLFHVSTTLEQNERRFLDKLTTQSKFNSANNNSMLRLNGQVNAYKEAMKQVNEMLENYSTTGNIDVSEIHFQQSDDPVIYDFRSNISKCLQYATWNQLETHLNDVDKAQIQKFLPKVSTDKSFSCLLKEFFEQDIKLKNQLWKKIRKLKELLFSKTCLMTMQADVIDGEVDLSVLTKSLSMVTDEVEHLKKKLSWKDTALDKMQRDLNSLLVTSGDSYEYAPVHLQSQDSSLQSRDPSSKKDSKLYTPALDDKFLVQTPPSLPVNQRILTTSPELNREQIMENLFLYTDSESDDPEDRKLGGNTSHAKRTIKSGAPTFQNLKKDKFVPRCPKAVNKFSLRSRTLPITKLPINVSQLTLHKLAFN